MTVFQMLKEVENEKQFAALIVEIVKDCKTSEEVQGVLNGEVTEELQTIKNAALKGCSLSLDGLCLLELNKKVAQTNSEKLVI